MLFASILLASVLLVLPLEKATEHPRFFVFAFLIISVFVISRGSDLVERIEAAAGLRLARGPRRPIGLFGKQPRCKRDLLGLNIVVFEK